jgi:hypothetical protein
VGSSSERLDPPLDEGPNKLNARKLFIRCGSKLLDFLHQWLCDLHLLIRKLMSPRHPWSKDGGGPKLLESEVFTSGELVLGVFVLQPGLFLGVWRLKYGTSGCTW